MMTWRDDERRIHRSTTSLFSCQKQYQYQHQDQDWDLRHQDQDQDQDFSVQDQDQDFQNTVSRPRPKSREPHVCFSLKHKLRLLHIYHIYVHVITKVCVYVYVHSRSISCFILCLTHLGVGDCGQPVSVRRQDEQTEASSVNARHSELLDLPDWYEQRSSSASKSREYSITNVLISTISNNSSGRSLSFYRKHYNITLTLQLITFLT